MFPRVRCFSKGSRPAGRGAQAKPTSRTFHPPSFEREVHSRRDVHGEIFRMGPVIFWHFFQGTARGVRFLLHTMPKRHSLSLLVPAFGAIFLRFFWLRVTADGHCPSGEGQPMQDMQESLVKLRADAAEFLMMSVLATDAQKREHFARLADHLNVLASEIARAIAEKVGDSTPSG
jgi:hypothetical protein